MNRACSIFLLVGISLAAFGQRADYDHYSYAERQSKFPFNKAKSVKLVSFGLKSRHFDDHDEPRIPFFRGHTDLSMVDEVVDIPFGDIDSIADILMNTCHRLDSFETVYVFCYMPRHAAIFYDGDGKEMTYLEICFECQKIFSDSPQFYFDTLKCDNIYSDLRGFFDRRGFETNFRKLSRKLDELQKTDEEPGNLIWLSQEKMEVIEKKIANLIRKESGQHKVDLSRLRFSYPDEIHKLTTFFKVRAFVGNAPERIFVVEFPSYEVVEEIQFMRKLYK